MNTNNNEKHILFIIKYLPTIFIITLSFIVMFFVYKEIDSSFIKEKEKIKKTFINEKKTIIKNDVNIVFKMIKNLEKTSNTLLKDYLKRRTYEAHTLSTTIYNINKEKSKKEILEILKKTFKTYRYNNGRGYFFFDDKFGKKVIYPIDENIEGKNFIEFKDTKGYQFVKTISQTVKDKTERFDEYYWYKPNDESKKSFKKISFYKYFEPLDLIIGTGEYIDDYQLNLKKEAFQTIKNMTLDSDNYFYIFEDDKVIHNFQKKYIGKRYQNIKDIKNLIIDKTKDKQFLEYELKIEGEFIKKIGFVKYVKEWDWYVGKSFYLDKLKTIINKKEENIKETYRKYLLNIFISSTILVLLLMITSMFVSKYLKNNFKNYKKDIQRYLNDNLKQQEILHQQAKLVSMGEMIRNIAHQWRQPLSVISTVATGTLLQKTFNGKYDDKKIEDNLHTINETTQFLSQTIEDFLNYFKNNKKSEKFKISDTINKKILPLLKSFFIKNRIEMIFNNKSDFELNTTENDLIQSLLNVINNSKDALADNDKIENKMILIHIYKENNNYLNIVIQDNAGGVKKEIINKIFEPYFTTKHQSQGTGIGLYMTKDIVEKSLNGFIETKNKEIIYKDKTYIGLEFKIKIPLIN